jgi:hypothetical protein
MTHLRQGMHEDVRPRNFSERTILFHKRTRLHSAERSSQNSLSLDPQGFEWLDESGPYGRKKARCTGTKQ